MNVTEWLLDSDPSIRWQVMRDLIDEAAEAVASERSRVAREGWGARLLRLQDEQGAGDGRLLGRLLGEQLQDGGWNCEAPDKSRRSSFHTTINVLEGLWEYERAAGPDPAVTAARSRGEEYLLERRLLRRLSTGEVVKPDWTRFSFPPRWYYDVLRGLDYFRSTMAAPDERCREAIELVLCKRRPDGRWPLENPHEGPVHFDIDPGPGEPSRWNTLRALRVLRWYDRALP